MPPSALYGCTIKRLHLTEEVPPILVGEGKGLQNTILYVPAESVELYKRPNFGGILRKSVHNRPINTISIKVSKDEEQMFSSIYKM